MDAHRVWPERIVAVNDEGGALIEYQALAPGDIPEPGDVEYVRADLHRRAVVLDDDTLTDLDKRASIRGTDRAAYLRWVLTGATNATSPRKDA